MLKLDNDTNTATTKDNSQQLSEGKKPAKKRGRTIAIIVASVIIICAALVLIFFINSKDNLNETTMSEALQTGVLTYYSSGNAEYDQAYMNALDQVSTMTDELNMDIEAALQTNIDLAYLLADAYFDGSGDIPWLANNRMNIAATYQMQTIYWLDMADSDALPADLDNTSRPLYLLKAADSVQQATINLLIANGYYDTIHIANDGTHWDNTIQIWDEAKPEMTDLVDTTAQLSYLIDEIADVENDLFMAEIKNSQESIDLLQESISDKVYSDDEVNDLNELLGYLDEIAADETQTLTTAYQSIGNTYPLSTVNLSSTVYASMDENALNTLEGDYNDATTSLNNAVDDASVKQGDFLNAKAAEDNDMVVGYFIAAGITYTDTDSADSASQSAWSINAGGTADDKRAAFYSTTNASIQDAYDQNFDADSDYFVNMQKDPDFVAKLALAPLFNAAIDAAENRDPADDSIAQNTDNDKILSIMLAQAKGSDISDTYQNYGFSIDALPDDIIGAIQSAVNDANNLTVIYNDQQGSIDDDLINNLNNAADYSDTINNYNNATAMLTNMLDDQIICGLSNSTGADDFFGTLKDFFKPTDEGKKVVGNTIGKEIGEMVDEAYKEFEKDPETALKNVLNDLGEITRSSEDLRPWMQFAKDLKDIMQSETIIKTAVENSIADEVLDAWLNIQTETEVIENSNLEDETTWGNDNNDYSEYNYSGNYAITCTLIDSVWTTNPYNPNDPAVTEWGMSESDWYENAQFEYEQSLDDPYFEHLEKVEGNIEIIHDSLASNVIMKYHIFLGDVFKSDETLQYSSSISGNTFAFSSAAFNQAAPGMQSVSSGEISFIVNDDTTVRIEGEVKTIYPGGYNRVENTYTIEGVQFYE